MLKKLNNSQKKTPLALAALRLDFCCLTSVEESGRFQKKKKTPEIPRKRQRVSWSLLDLCHLGILLSRCRPINGRHGSCRTLWCGIPFISGPWCLESGKVANSTTSSRNSSKKLGISRWPAWLRGNLSLQHVIHSSTLGWQNRYDGDNFSLSLSDHLECDWILFGGLFKWP